MPTIKDNAAWKLMLLEHRRSLLERMLVEFPDILVREPSKVEQLRLRLKLGCLVSASL
jgi:hypothetical protein